MPLRERKIEFHQVLKEDGSVHSHQWTDLPLSCAKDLSVEQVVKRYLTYLRDCTFSLVRPQYRDEGLALCFLGMPLIGFCLPMIKSANSTTSADLFINGGLLVQRDSCNRGQLRFTVSGPFENRIRIEVRLSDYCPLLLGNRTPTRFRKWLYHITQSTIHKIVTVRFLARLYEELTGVRPPINVIKNNLPGSEDI